MTFIEWKYIILGVSYPAYRLKQNHLGGTYKVFDLLILVQGHVILSLPTIGAVGDTEAKLQVILSHQLVLHKQFSIESCTPVYY